MWFAGDQAYSAPRFAAFDLAARKARPRGNRVQGDDLFKLARTISASSSPIRNCHRRT